MRRKPGRATVMLAMVLCGTPILDAQSGAKNGEWRTYGGDLDKATGNEVGNVFMPAPQTGSPMTYMLGGKHTGDCHQRRGLSGRADCLQRSVSALRIRYAEACGDENSKGDVDVRGWCRRVCSGAGPGPHAFGCACPRSGGLVRRRAEVQGRSKLAEIPNNWQFGKSPASPLTATITSGCCSGRRR